MAPPPVDDLFDWRVPNVALLAMICVSRVYESDAFGDGLRAPPRTGRFSPAASANGVTSRATSTAATTIQGPWPRNRVRVRMLLSIGESTSLADGRQAYVGARYGGTRPPCLCPCNRKARAKVAVLQDRCQITAKSGQRPGTSR